MELGYDGGGGEFEYKRLRLRASICYSLVARRSLSPLRLDHHSCLCNSLPYGLLASTRLLIHSCSPPSLFMISTNNPLYSHMLRYSLHNRSMKLRSAFKGSSCIVMVSSSAIAASFELPAPCHFILDTEMQHAILFVQNLDNRFLGHICP
jgi:hypothetical protein